MATCAFELITPEIAQALLDVNHRNRELIEGSVDRWAGAMLRGEWHPDCPDGIAIDKDGGVVNGQNRLRAIVKTGIAQTMLVVRDVDPDVIMITDVGRARNFAQWLKMTGAFQEGRAGLVATAVELIYRLERGFETSMPEALKPTVPQLMDVLDVHKNVESSLPFAAPVQKWSGIPKATLAAYHYAFAVADAEKAEDFYEKLGNGQDLVAGEATAVLREMYSDAWKKASNGKPVPVHQREAWLVKGWEAHRSGQEVKSKDLKWLSSGKGQPFPRPTDVPWIPIPAPTLSSLLEKALSDGKGAVA